VKRLAAIYLLVIAVLATGKWKSGSKGSEMHWSEVKEVSVPAKPTGVWTWAIDYVKGPVRILVEADAGGTWSYSPEGVCGPDGDLNALLTGANMLLPSAPIGALLMKIGGSTAGSADGTVRVAGGKAYFEIDKSVTGPLFLTINDEPGGMIDNSGALKVKVSLAPLATPVTAPAPPAGGGDGDAGAEEPKPGAPSKTEAPRPSAPKER
jgi:PA-IL-like protein